MWSFFTPSESTPSESKILDFLSQTRRSIHELFAWKAHPACVHMLDLNYNIFIFQFNSKDSLQQKNIQSFE